MVKALKDLKNAQLELHEDQKPAHRNRMYTKTRKTGTKTGRESAGSMAPNGQ